MRATPIPGKGALLATLAELAAFAPASGPAEPPASGRPHRGRQVDERAQPLAALGDDAYDVTTEFEVEGRWVPGFSLHMRRQPHAPT